MDPWGRPGASWRGARQLPLRKNEFENPGVGSDSAGDPADDLGGLRFGQLERRREALGDGVRSGDTRVRMSAPATLGR